MKIVPNHFKMLISGATFVALLSAVYAVVAASQGSLGTSSTGSLMISVTKPARANISDLNDLSIAGWSPGDGAKTVGDDVCVYSTRSGGGYTVKASGSGAGSAFTVVNGIFTMPYTLVWNDGGVGALSNTGTLLAANVTSPALANASTDSSTCNGAVAGPTARLRVTVTAAAFEAANAGNYTGILTLLVAPN
jgi:hypothetical protein